MSRSDTSTADDAGLELLTIDDLSRLLKRSRASLHRDLAAGRLPRPIRFGAGSSAVRWRRQTVLAWLESLAANEDARPVERSGVDGSNLAQQREGER